MKRPLLVVLAAQAALMILPAVRTRAAQVGEPRPQNRTANVYLPSPEELACYLSKPAGGASFPYIDPVYFTRVNGHFSGTTSQILEWAAHKWSFEPDLVKAIAMTESKWKQGAHGDLNNVTFADPDGGSWGILQIKENSWPLSYPLSHLSTAFNADFKCAVMATVRDYKGPRYLLSRPARPGHFRYGDPEATMDDRIWGAVGNWYSGGWWDPHADSYVAEVKGYLAAQPWTKPGF